MTAEYEKCEYCCGTGTILEHLNHTPVSGQQPTGNGTVSCPRCNGSGKTNIRKESNGSDVSSSSDGSNAWAFIIAWGVLFYLTYQLTIALAEMIFGKEVNAPEFVKWLIVIFMLIPPTVLVFVFRKIIPSLFYIVLIGGILAFFVAMVSNL